jgi:pimeloyl-ACP methyl ester carboxylesterase
LTAIFLHGLLGSSRNWRTFTRKLATSAARLHGQDVRCLLVDLRAHGMSSGLKGAGPAAEADASPPPLAWTCFHSASSGMHQGA